MTLPPEVPTGLAEAVVTAICQTRNLAFRPVSEENITNCEKPMTTITLPVEIEKSLAEAARKQGVTPERLAVESLRNLFGPAELVVADAVMPMTYTQMAQAYRVLGKVVPDEDAELEVDLDDYPLY